MRNIKMLLSRIWEFYFGGFRETFKRAIVATAGASTVAGVVIIVIHKIITPGQRLGEAMISLLEEAPLIVFAALLVALFFYVPYIKYEELKIKKETAEREKLDFEKHATETRLDAERLSKVAEKYKEDLESSLAARSNMELERDQARGEALRLKDDLESAQQILAENEQARQRGCPDDFLHNIAEIERPDIAPWVRVKHAEIEKRFDDPFPNVIVKIVVLNLSVFKVNLGEQIEGKIAFRGQRLYESPRSVRSVCELPHDAAVLLELEQRLTKSELERIADTERLIVDSALDFQNLKISITGGLSCRSLSPTQLRLPESVFFKEERLGDRLTLSYGEHVFGVGDLRFVLGLLGRGENTIYLHPTSATREIVVITGAVT
ncbi:MAG TPA: hypothetical protein VI756_29840, partial [Blastocatellia bacterium]